MNFATDRDLLILEPNLVRDVGWAGQTLARGNGSVAGSRLTIDAIDLQVRAVTIGMVALVGGLPLEITGFVNSSTAEVSLIRDNPAAPVRPPFNLAPSPTSITTFSPQIALAHAQLLRMFGLEPAGSPAAALACAMTEDRVTNARDLSLLESLCALHMIYSAASAMLGPDSAPGRRADLYAQRFAAERFRAVAKLDLDGDSIPDTHRRASVMQLTRG